ncbi:RagB/SusD family nutrient uptake outer membrane protein [Aliifodinibius sp. S!AR15-10]|uniref:RagB/SusD family nutrient uptake outer membrane protein n=1 Tax=Aliifodinibius sp. S!AR15-10 TaxID=2950437 RepID=UPI00286731C1|nr:RagB/SusD family nutrient uptake outer membrane protein [Aliifodinibius sp. S!AR15-10]MDR8393343.1 RagB/SusD family nutrient uptake outer membrane protein [Aliifodinibius sp. S!AR15-10]
MRKYIRIFTASVVLTCTIWLSGCQDNFLSITPQDRITENQVWTDANLVKLYVNDLYKGIPHGLNRHMWNKLTDEAYGNGDWLEGEVGADDIGNYGEDFNYLDYYQEAFQYIRRYNVFMSNIDSAPLSDAEKASLTAEVKFLRAYTYANLLWRYGGVPIVEEVYELDGADNEFSRASYQETFNHIITLLDEAMPELAEKYETSDSNYGRATKHAAMALKSRVYLYDASALNNPNNDQAKWQQASDAAKALIDEQAYSLEPDYGQVFQSVNNELIFARNFSSTNGHNASFLNLPRPYGGYGGWGGSNCPSQNLVDAYEMANGEMIFNDDGTINQSSGYDPQNPYVDRDPRFYASILHHGTTFREVELDYSEEIEIAGGDTTFTGVRGNANYKVTGDNSVTGYNMKKFIEQNMSVPISRSQNYTQPWPLFRLAEIYLNYAEAQYHLGNPDEARDYVDMVRNRAGMPDLDDTLTGQELLERIRHERRIELVFEGHRFWDIRRWEIAPEVETHDIEGIDIYRKKSNGEIVFERKRVLDRPEQWDTKYYKLPIPRDEINKSSVEQTEGYN